jgi:DNA-binding MarR family transcriptional regulator
VAEDPSRWGAFYALSHANSEIAVRLLAEALSLSSGARLARLLLRLGGPTGVVEARQEELARLIGLTRSSYQRSLRDLIERGAVVSGYGRIDLRDPALLARIGDEA